MESKTIDILPISVENFFDKNLAYSNITYVVCALAGGYYSGSEFSRADKSNFKGENQTPKFSKGVFVGKFFFA